MPQPVQLCSLPCCGRVRLAFLALFHPVINAPTPPAPFPAAAYMIAAAAGHPNPIALAHHAAGLAVSQPQSCKPRCVTTALESGLGPQLAMLRGWAPVQRLVLPPLQLMARLLGLAARGSSGGGSSTAAS